MELTVLNNVRKKFMDALNSLKVFLKNDRPKRKAVKAPSSINYWDKLVHKKDVLNYKGSAYKGKGSINTDAATFNKLRKDEHPGRQH